MKKIIEAVLIGMLLSSCQISEPLGPTDIQSDLDDAVTGVPGDSIPVEPDGSIGGGKELVAGSIFINATELLIMESFPIQVMLSVVGDLPTPCDTFAYTIEEPNQEYQIHVDIYSLGEEGMICIQVLEPFEENISVLSLDTTLEDGTYTVWVNGELVGDFNYPG